MITLEASNPILDAALSVNASDIHLRDGSKPRFRSNGSLGDAGDTAASKDLLTQLAGLRAAVRANATTTDDDFAFTYQARRFRVNAYTTLLRPGAVIRVIPAKIRTLAELGTPVAFTQLLDRMEGLIIISGATGDGKSTTMAAAVDYLNRRTRGKLVSLEDPVEYLHTEDQLVVDQRELHSDFVSFAEGLRSALRQDPDIIVIGELRDAETMRLAIEASETGHLVLATLHAPTTEKAAARIVDAFPEGEQAQQRAALASASAGFLCQRLLPALGGGRVAAFELAITNGPIRPLIRDGRFANIPGEIRTRAKLGMQTLDMALARLVRAKKINPDEASKHAVYPDELPQLIAHL